MSARPEIVPYQPKPPVVRSLAYELPNEETGLPQWVKDWQMGRISPRDIVLHRPKRDSRCRCYAGECPIHPQGRKKQPPVVQEQATVGGWNIKSALDQIQEHAKLMLARSGKVNAQMKVKLEAIAEFTNGVKPLLEKHPACFLKADGSGHDEPPDGCAKEWLEALTVIESIIQKPKYATIYGDKVRAQYATMRSVLEDKARKEADAKGSNTWKWLAVGGAVILGLWAYRKMS